ncbi:tetratricopeptide repeat protein [Roseicyclus sp.]
MIRKTLLTAGFAALLAPAALAVGPDDDPPTPTETTTECAEGTVWDGETQACVAIEESAQATDPEALITTVRELAYAGRHGDALALLARAPDQGDTMVLTYMGYSTRSMGDMQTGLDHYDRALAADPDNLLARAYLGMARLQLGETGLAEVQLAEIRARGGVGRWPERALAAAIAQGSPAGYDY